jgi:hypothetical protein
MTDIEYLGIEGGDHDAGSWDALIDEFVQLVRFSRTEAAANDASQYMARIRKLESELQQVEHLGEPDRQYFDEVWEVLQSEPPSDDSHIFCVFMLTITEAGTVVMRPTDATFHHPRRAAHWIRERGEKEQQYVIQEVFQT